jgi:AcrR family transcriptional regulator
MRQSSILSVMNQVAVPKRRPPRGQARERILETAYELFGRGGVRAVGVDTIADRSGVTKVTLYRQFGSKDALVRAFLARREELWLRGWLEAEVERRASAPADRLLAIFDAFDAWFHRDDFEGCPFINTMLETFDWKHPLHEAARQHLSTIREFVLRLAEEAGVRDREALADEWNLLMRGAIVSAQAGDREAARRARELGSLLLERETAG